VVTKTMGLSSSTVLEHATEINTSNMMANSFTIEADKLPNLVRRNATTQCG